MVRKFPVPGRDVTTKLSLGGNNDGITELFLPRESLVSDIPAGDGKLVNLFLRCTLCGNFFCPLCGFKFINRRTIELPLPESTIKNIRSLKSRSSHKAKFLPRCAECCGFIQKVSSVYLLNFLLELPFSRRKLQLQILYICTATKINLKIKAIFFKIRF
jgi:hypothetical protein